MACAVAEEEGWGETVVDVEAKDRTKQRRKYDGGRRRRGCRRTCIHCRTTSQSLLRIRVAGAVKIITTLLYVGDLNTEVDESGFNSTKNKVLKILHIPFLSFPFWFLGIFICAAKNL
ncbi:hypothetical protein AHAS_Ahas20G0120500 [Arachis hypogaea]